MSKLHALYATIWTKMDLDVHAHLHFFNDTKYVIPVSVSIHGMLWSNLCRVDPLKYLTYKYMKYMYYNIIHLTTSIYLAKVKYPKDVCDTIQ